MTSAMIVGAGGQLGRALQHVAPGNATVHAFGSQQLDITDRAQVAVILNDVKPDIVFNAAAYTAVDKAETDEAAAFAINGAAVEQLSQCARDVGARFVHVSTDFVFDGMAGVPYAVDAATNPIGVYGRSKLAGEQAAGADALIVRTAWVYAPTGNNFVRTMLRLMAERPEVRVVADQIGTPTYAPALAAALWSLAIGGATGIHHYTDSGVASWYDFAVAIQEEALAIGLLNRQVPVIPITTADFPTPARRPHFSVLDKQLTYALLGEVAPHWRAQLRIMLNEIKVHG